jgi:hypothetical protein
LEVGLGGQQLKNSTDIFGGLRDVYQQYGGVRSIFSSQYFLLAFILLLPLSGAAIKISWLPNAIDMLPTLASFSLAAFALLFAILGDEARGILSTPSETLGGRVPLLVLSSGIAHSVVIQVFALIFAMSLQARFLPNPFESIVSTKVLNTAFSYIGLFIYIYGILLVLANMLTVFKLMKIVADSSVPKEEQ